MAAEQQDPDVLLGQLKKFSFRELQIATDNFNVKNILGKGGFGNVYKGHLSDGTIVAVKRLKGEGSPGAEMQFQTEVEMISLAVHRNLLRLRGFCMTPSERLLVYPYMPNGSVASRLRGELRSIMRTNTVVNILVLRSFKMLQPLQQLLQFTVY